MTEYILSWEKTKEIREFRKLFLFSGKYHGKKLFKIAIDLFYSCNCEDLIDLLEVEAQKEVFKVFKNNRVWIINKGTEWKIGVSAESNLSCNRLWSKMYSEIILKNMLNERAYKLTNDFLYSN